MGRWIGGAGLAAARLAARKAPSLLSILERPGRVDWSRLAEALGGHGQRLDEEVRARMEGLIGRDLSGARVHTGPQVERLARHMNAEAFTLGSSVFAPAEAIDPSRPGGAGLLAHELTHLAQQIRPLPLGRAQDPELGGGDPSAHGLPVRRTVAVQRTSTSAGEEEAEAVERAGRSLSGESPRPAPAEVDVEALAERVYELMRREILTENERQGQSWS